jgi:K(+)-stimulated pyrophosphate-energized sodium pump
VNLVTFATVTEIFTHAWIWFIAPIAAVLALYMARHFSRMVMEHSEGEPDMIDIADSVRQGAMAYLRRQYKVVGGVFVLLVVVLALMAAMGIQSWVTVFGVPLAGLLSGLCGWFGMKMATNASARTAFAAKQSLNEGLTVAFRAGAVMGLIVVGFALLDVSFWFFVWNMAQQFGWAGDFTLVEITAVMLTFGMGASTQALFARVGGGIYTKAADVGADLVGKVEAGIPEDDPRNPATIADNVGDNVGDVAGMGADLYESYYGSMLATLALGAAAAYSILSGGEAATLAVKLAAAPMALAGLGILCSLAGIYVVKAKEDATFSQLLKSLHSGVWSASAIIAVASLLLFWLLFGGVAEINHWGMWGAIMSGLIAGNIIAVATEYYTSYEHKPTQSIAEQAQTGPATVIIAGTAVGMISTWVPILTIVLAILFAFSFAGGGTHFLLGLYGVGIAAVGMLSTLGITLATDAYGPIADNAGGNAQMTDQPPYVRERTDMLDSLGNTTAATGKGFAIGSAALTALALLAAYISVVQTSLNRQLTPDDATAAALVQNVDAGIRQAYERDEDAQGLDVDHHHGQRPAVLTAEYRGYRQLAVVDIADHNRSFGGLLIIPDHVYRHFVDQYPIGSQITFADAEWNPSLNVYDINHSYLHHDHWHHDEFQLVATDRAGIRQILTYYDVTLMNPRVLGGIFLGVLLAFVFCALTMQAVGRAAYAMMNECRRQFAIMREAFRAQGMSEADMADATRWPRRAVHNGKTYPDYAECVAISTAGAQREMIGPAFMAILVPILVGLVLGVGGTMGLLAGGLTSGFAVAIFMANAGGAWDNAKKYIEKGHYGGKGSEAHKAGVVGDTVGDPFKDTSGPSLNILIKLIAIVSVVFAGLTVAYSEQIGAWIGLG